jgi:hypothetical protein
MGACMNYIEIPKSEKLREEMEEIESDEKEV